MFIDEECGNCKVVVDGGEFTRNNNKKKRSEVIKPTDVNSVINTIDKIQVGIIFPALILVVGYK